MPSHYVWVTIDWIDWEAVLVVVELVIKNGERFRADCCLKLLTEGGAVCLTSRW